MRLPVVSVALLLAACSDSTPVSPDAAVRDRPAATEASADLPRADLSAALEGPRAERGKDAVADLAPLTGPFRIVTFNVKCLLDNPATRAKGIAAELQKLNPDAVAFQELCQAVGSNGSDNFAGTIGAELKALTGEEWEYRWIKASIAWNTSTFPGYEEGVGVVARKGAFLQSGTHPLPQGSGPFPRIMVWGQVGTPRGSFFLYSIHLTTSSVWQDRQAQVKEALVVVNQHLSAGLPQIVAGDFNDKYCSGPITALESGTPAFTNAWKSKYPTKMCSDSLCGGGSCSGTACGCTIDSSNPTSCIDYIFIRSASLKTVNQAQVVFDQKYNGAYLSDHLGLFAEFAPP
jgi:endonuclease/exonuclease/phosphatase family metal-dependent hydrolase